LKKIDKPNLDKPEKIRSKVKVQRSKVKVKNIDASIEKMFLIDCVGIVLKN
jgi:hypothetical protein